MAVPSQVVFTQGNTQDIRIYGLQDIRTGLFWNAATASGALFDQNGNATEVLVALTYQTSSTGNYFGSVTTDFNLDIGGGYVLKLDATQGGSKFHMELPARVIARVS